MKTIYTDSAQRELEAFSTKQRIELEHLIASRKSVLGDDVLEITASDIKEASRYFRVVMPSKYDKGLTVGLVTGLYILGGAGMVIYGLFYDYVHMLFRENPERAATIGAGFSIMIAGITVQYFLRARERRRKLLIAQSRADSTAGEPSMEEILASIRKIIAEDSEPDAL